jgi:hypothetical protein
VSDPVGWLLRPAENATAVPHRARFRHWVSSGERGDYAAVLIEPPLDPTESGISETLTRVILAPRHRGVTLKSLAQFPAHVYVVTARQDLEDAARIQPDALKIRIWGVLEGVIQST